MSTYFRLELIESSAKEVFIFGGLWSREKREGASEKKTLHKSSETRDSIKAKKNY